MKKYRFYKNEEGWFIDLPAYIEQGGNISNLQMVEGADEMLDIMSNREQSVTLAISNTAFNGADMLILKEKAEPIKGGGYYFMQQFENKEINLNMWLCDVTEFVFGEMPQQIFMKKELD